MPHSKGNPGSSWPEGCQPYEDECTCEHPMWKQPEIRTAVKTTHSFTQQQHPDDSAFFLLCGIIAAFFLAVWFIGGAIVNAGGRAASIWMVRKEPDPAHPAGVVHHSRWES